MINRYIKKLIFISILLLISTNIYGCSDIFSEDNFNDNSGSSNYSYNNGNIDPYDAGNQGSWTIFVYMCGSDLESEDASGTDDISEMLSISLDNNVRYVIETGGADYWQGYDISSDQLERYEIINGELNYIDGLTSQSMGESSTFEDFIIWGSENYSAENTGLVLWNHGSGSIEGVCSDEIYDYDSLTLSELDNALNNCSTHYEFIGFDACLMSTIETANVLAPHANYMIASEETESGYGWDYSVISEYLNEYSEANGAQLGTIICDGYYNTCVNSGEDNLATLSVTDLAKVDNIVKALDNTANEMSNSVNDVTMLGNISKGITKAENYGGNTPSEGYTNMVDLGDILINISEEIPSAKTALDAINDAVVYQIKGSSRQGANGLSIYYPLNVENTDELSTFADICVSNNYLSFVNKILYSSQYGDIADYSDDYGLESYDEYDVDTDNHISPVIIEDPAHLNEDNYYTLTIDPSTMDYVNSIQYSIYADWYDDDYMYYIGSDNNLEIDYNTGEVIDCFDGYWPALPDGQLLLFYVIEENEDYTLFSAPITLNGEDTNLRFLYNYDKSEYEVLGCWNGIDKETGVSSKKIIKLKADDVIAPYYESYDYNTGEEYYEYGDDYTLDSKFIIEDYLLPEGDYYYSFEIIDIYGTSTYSDEVAFYVNEDGEVEVYTDED